MTLQYFRANHDGLIEYSSDNKSTNTYSIANLNAEKGSMELALAAMPINPTDEQLLEWARINYPLSNHANEREILEERLEKINFLLQKAEELA